MRKMVSLVLAVFILIGMLGMTSMAVAEEAGLTTISILGYRHNADYLQTMEDYERQPTWQAMTQLMADAGLALDIEFISPEQFNVVVQTRMASANNLPDIVNAEPLGSAGIIALGENGIVHDLVPLIEQYSNGNIMRMYTEEFPFAKAISMTEDGKMYWFTSVYKKQYRGELSPTGVAFSMRKDWLDKLDLAIPESPDAFYDALVAFRENDVNGNGQADEIVSFDFSSFATVIPQYFGLASSVVTTDAATGEVVSPWYQDGIKDYILFVQKMIESGIVDPSIVGSNEVAIQRKAENRVGASATWISTSDIQLITTVTAEGAEGVSLYPFNAIDGAPMTTYSEEPQGSFNNFVITNQCSNLEAAIKFFDVVYSDAYATLSFYGVEGKTYEIGEDGFPLRYENMYGYTAEENFANLSVNGTNLWHAALPRVQYMEYEPEIATINSANAARAGEIALVLARNEHWYPMYAEALLAMPTTEEAERTNELLNGITTYSTELITKLCLNQLSLDDWDSYMAEFDALGLPELIEIYQARSDRYKAIMG